MRADCELEWEAFQRLASCRIPSGFGIPSQIPWTAIHTYATEFLSLRHFMYMEFVEVIEAVDRYYLTWLAEQLKKPPQEETSE